MDSARRSSVPPSSPERGGDCRATRRHSEPGPPQPGAPGAPGEDHNRSPHPTYDTGTAAGFDLSRGLHLYPLTNNGPNYRRFRTTLEEDLMRHRPLGGRRMSDRRLVREVHHKDIDFLDHLGYQDLRPHVQDAKGGLNGGKTENTARTNAGARPSALSPWERLVALKERGGRMLSRKQEEEGHSHLFATKAGQKKHLQI